MRKNSNPESVAGEDSEVGRVPGSVVVTRAYVFALALTAAAGAAEPPLAPAAATWEIRGKPGAVTAVIGRIKAGGRIIADRFVADPAFVKEERGGFAAVSARPGTCGSVSPVRPFTRLRRFAANGRLLWEWHVDAANEAIKLQASYDADCLSPDGRWLTTMGYARPGGGALVEISAGVLAVDRSPVVGVAIGRRTHTRFGTLRITDVIGWRRGRPATLAFYVNGDNGATSTIDEAVATRR